MPSDVTQGDPAALAALQQRQAEMAAGISTDQQAAETAEATASVAQRLDMHEGAIGRLHARLARIEEIAGRMWREHFSDAAPDREPPQPPPSVI